MTSVRAQMLYYGDDEEGNLSVKTVYLDADSITSFYIESPEEINGKQIKCYGITCDGAYYSIVPEPHVYQIIFDKFIKNAIKEKRNERTKV